MSYIKQGENATTFNMVLDAEEMQLLYDAIVQSRLPVKRALSRLKEQIYRALANDWRLNMSVEHFIDRFYQDCSPLIRARTERALNSIGIEKMGEFCREKHLLDLIKVMGTHKTFDEFHDNMVLLGLWDDKKY